MAGESLTNLRNANASYFDLYQANDKIINLIEQVATNDLDIRAEPLASRRRHVERVAGIRTRLQARGLARIDAGVHTTAGVLVWMLSRFACWSSTSPGEHVQVEETVTATWARAVGLEN